MENRETHEFALSLGVEYETLNRRLTKVHLKHRDVEPDFEGILFSIFALLANNEEFKDIPEEGIPLETRVSVFRRKQIYIRGILSGMSNFLSIMNHKTNADVPLHKYYPMFAQLGDIMVAMAATACNLDPKLYREETNKFYNEYIEQERPVQKQGEVKRDEPPRPRDFS